jgi:hypothetical protein
MKAVLYNACVKRILLLVACLLLPSTLLAQSWWGNLISANDTYQDVQTGQSFSCRFTAPWSGAVTAAAFPVTNLGALPISEVGTASLHADDGTGLPGVSLSSVPATLTTNWNRIAFPGVALDAGTTYHLVYQVGGPGIRFKLSDLYHDQWIPSDATVNAGWQWLYNPSGTWSESMHDPALVLEFIDGRRWGNPYNDNSPALNIGIGGSSPLMELHDNGTASDATDDRCAGQVFRAPSNGICVAHSFEIKEAMFQAPNAPLQWTLEEVSGFDVASGSVPAASLLWLPVSFTAPVTLWAGREYRLWFKAAQPPASPHILSCAWHAGSGADWNDLTWGGAGMRAQTSANGGATWTDHANGDLAFRMDIDTGPFAMGQDAPSLWISRNVLHQGETMTFRIETIADGQAGLSVYNSAGEKVKGLLNESLPSGTVKDLTWDGKNEFGEKVAAGVYMVHLFSPRGALTNLFVVVH